MDDNILSFPRDRKELEAAATWLARLDRGLEEHERAELKAWLRENRANADSLLELAAVWDHLGLLSELSGLLPLERPVRPRRTLKYAAGALTAVAAALLCGVGIRIWLAEPVETSSPTAAASYHRTFGTSIGERAVEELPDGSRITLNTNTEVSVRYSDQQRAVEMRRGEAHFSIARDVERPFGVRAAGRVVQALGTAFNIRLDNANGLEVIVTEGEVSVFEAGEANDVMDRTAAPTAAVDFGHSAAPTALVEGQGLRLEERPAGGDAALMIQRLEPVDLDIKLAWQRGMVIFRGEPLVAVLAEFGRYTTTEFVLDSDGLAEVRVGGYFRAGDIEGLLAALKENFQISAERIGAERVVLRAQDSL